MDLKDVILPHGHGVMHEHVIEFAPKEEEFSKVSDLFSLLSDSSRVRIFWLLCHCEECVMNISALVGMSSPAVSHHLKQLKTSGLIISKRAGKEVFYKAADTQEAKLLHQMIEQMVAISCPDEKH